jgi:hypothetical protein
MLSTKKLCYAVKAERERERERESVYSRLKLIDVDSLNSHHAITFAAKHPAATHLPATITVYTAVSLNA